MSDEAGSSTYSQHLRLPQTELEAFLVRNSSLAGKLYIENHDLIRVYRITWE